MQQVLFRLLGPPEILYKEQLIKIPRRRSRALLYYLICTQTSQPRERLLTLLCGDVDEESARRTFKTLLAEVRALLRSFDTTIEWIHSEDDLIRLNPLAPWWIDTENFEKVSAVTSRNLNRVIDLYRGDFLDGFFLKDAPGFETWMRSTRAYFQHLYLTALRQLAELYEADNQFEQAIACTKMLLTTDPLLEEAYARLMHLYWRAGKRIDALREYERLCEVLAQELAVKPSASTQSLYEQIAYSSKRLPTPKLSASLTLPPAVQQLRSAMGVDEGLMVPFVGRTAEAAWLTSHLTESSSRALPLLLLSGEAGVGKTRLIQEALHETCSSWLLLQGTCQEVEQAHSYHAVVEALRRGLAQEDVTQIDLPGAWRTQLAQLLPDLFSSITSQGVPIEPLIVAEALGALLNALAHPQRPLLLVLDDLHWADAVTLALLGYLARSVQRGRVFLLGAFCTALEQGRLAPLRRSCARQNGLAELALSPLPAEDIAHLVSLSIGGEVTADSKAASYIVGADWCYQRSEGNPFFALAWLKQAGKSIHAEQRLLSLTIPESIVTLVRTQCDFLSREAHALLTVAAFMVSPFDLSKAAALIDLNKQASLVASAELLRAHLIIEVPGSGGGTYIFVHSSVREVIRTTVQPGQHLFFQHFSIS